MCFLCLSSAVVHSSLHHFPKPILDPVCNPSPLHISGTFLSVRSHTHSLLFCPTPPVQCPCSPCSLCCTHQAHEHDVGKTTQVAVAVVDTFVWQALASVAIPGFTINRICAASLYFLGTMTHWPLPIRKWMTTAIGLSAIPVIIKPIDRSVDFLMDSSLRKLYGAEEKRPSS
ncbi:mitochondrial fission process protein 1 isoform X1 [Mauremys mutica]|uniref:mitochondrial fission process protein 1 isoform X1 n=1 Tax=Mauremys mutica TaxID=74926 RepID=UPI001D166025|nr:mitochondrial fission process protein 1 isoform X1 [Mauremys mutica]